MNSTQKANLSRVAKVLSSPIRVPWLGFYRSNCNTKHVCLYFSIRANSTWKSAFWLILRLNRTQTRRYLFEIQQLVSTHQSLALSPPLEVPVVGVEGGVFLVSLYPKSSMRRFSPGGVLVSLPEIPKSFSVGGGVFLSQEYPILCDFDNKIFTLDIAPAWQI